MARTHLKLVEAEDEGDNRPPRYEENGRIIYRASSLMMCDRVFMALAEAYTPASNPEWFQEVLDEGTAMERPIIERYEEQFDAAVVGGQQVLEMEVIDGVWIRGHIDGERADREGVLIEAKKVRESSWGKFKRQGIEYIVHYPWQLSFYMHAGGYEEAEVVGGMYDKDEKAIKDLYVHSITQPPIPWKDIVKRIARLEAMVNSGKRVDDVKCNVRQFPCPFFYLHDADDEEAPPLRELPDELVEMIGERELIKAQTSELRKKAEELEPRVKEINKALEEWMRKASVDDDQFIRVEVGDEELDLKYHTVYRSAYMVQETDYTLVSVKKAKKATPKARTKGKATKAAEAQEEE